VQGGIFLTWLVEGGKNFTGHLNPGERGRATYCIWSRVEPSVSFGGLEKRKFPAPVGNRIPSFPVVLGSRIRNTVRVHIWRIYVHVVRRCIRRLYTGWVNRTFVQAGQPRNARCHSRKGQGDFLFPEAARLVLGPTTLLFDWCGGFFLEVKWLGRKPDHLPPSSSKVENTQGHASTPSYAFMAWCVIKYSVNCLLRVFRCSEIFLADLFSWVDLATQRVWVRSSSPSSQGQWKMWC
jgi:hypothetical protein